MKRGEKVQAQTEQRILSLSYNDFEAEFGFKPEDKLEQRHFAIHRERLTNPKQRTMAEKMDKSRKDAADRAKKAAAKGSV